MPENGIYVGCPWLLSQHAVLLPWNLAQWENTTGVILTFIHTYIPQNIFKRKSSCVYWNTLSLGLVIQGHRINFDGTFKSNCEMEHEFQTWKLYLMKLWKVSEKNYLADKTYVSWSCHQKTEKETLEAQFFGCTFACSDRSFVVW